MPWLTARVFIEEEKRATKINKTDEWSHMQEISQIQDALRAYGYQNGEGSLSSAGQALYSAYEAITNYLSFSA